MILPSVLSLLSMFAATFSQDLILYDWGKNQKFEDSKV